MYGNAIKDERNLNHVITIPTHNHITALKAKKFVHEITLKRYFFFCISINLIDCYVLLERNCRFKHFLVKHFLQNDGNNKEHVLVLFLYYQHCFNTSTSGEESCMHLLLEYFGNIFKFFFVRFFCKNSYFPLNCIISTI